MYSNGGFEAFRRKSPPRSEALRRAFGAFKRSEGRLSGRQTGFRWSRGGWRGPSESLKAAARLAPFSGAPSLTAPGARPRSDSSH